MKQRILALLLAAGLCLGIIGACIPAALAADETGVEEAVEVLAAWASSPAAATVPITRRTT